MKKYILFLITMLLLVSCDSALFEKEEYVYVKSPIGNLEYRIHKDSVFHNATVNNYHNSGYTIKWSYNDCKYESDTIYYPAKLLLNCYKYPIGVIVEITDEDLKKFFNGECIDLYSFKYRVVHLLLINNF